MEFNFFQLEKLKIKSYKTSTRTDIPEEFTAMFNPTSYTLFYKNVYETKQGINTSGREANYVISKPKELKLKLILDGNNVQDFGIVTLFNSSKNDVNKKVQEFLKMTTLMDGDIHEPRPLKLQWGDLHFKCRLASVNVNYTQFDASGIPLRAELDTVFFGDLETAERLKEENKSSPDLTHYRIMGAHDKLPLLCEKIYGSPAYYIEVAKVNKLKNFRDLKQGQRIYFPPIAK
ncbi:CIS tube protein [Tenacibaculum jejuense]|uniref:Contractile injection system tube protein N-terminal domain-containing protein n=1 Tax=Tenacibaculum jejuense TaxID=584609 RepID=A0A238UEB6_9FLAO|nr:hypothetical protein [Tenacibaculum jejuense]SNR16928.1 conserved protein of unknown function [Tenacibaculum jejuense]